MNAEIFKNIAEELTNRLDSLISEMTEKGDSQKVCLLNKLRDLEYTINCVVDEDFKEEKN